MYICFHLTFKYLFFTLPWASSFLKRSLTVLMKDRILFFFFKIDISKQVYIVWFYMSNVPVLVKRAFYLFACRSAELGGVCSVAEKTHQISKYTSPILAHTSVFAQTFPQSLSSLQQKSLDCKIYSWNFQPSAFQIPDNKVRWSSLLYFVL